MSDLNRLKELAALFKPKAVPAEVVAEDASQASLHAKFEALKKSVEETLNDLEFDLGAGGKLESMLDKHGLMGLDSKKDDDGDDLSVVKRMNERVERFKKAIDRLMLEVELMVASFDDAGK